MNTLTYTYTLKLKNDFEYQIKNGAKVIEKFLKVKGGWYVCCKTFESFELALSYWERMQLNTMEAMSNGNEVFKIVIVRK